MKSAMNIFKNITETKISKDEQELISLRYLIGLANIYYILNMNNESLAEGQNALEICNDEQRFTSETM